MRMKPSRIVGFVLKTLYWLIFFCFAGVGIVGELFGTPDVERILRDLGIPISYHTFWIVCMGWLLILVVYLLFKKIAAKEDKKT